MVDLSLYDKVFVLCDENTEQHCLPRFKAGVNYDEYGIDAEELSVITVAAGDENKTLATATQVWKELQDRGATRHSVLINLGGGMVSDLGGFVASTFKRGIAYINIPTTLLSMVDASTGGKTGVNFGGLKNEIGVFNKPSRILFNTEYFRTLDYENFLSGYAEMLKHGLISKADILDELLSFDLDDPDYQQLERMIRRSVGVKKYFVERDPSERHMRKALNFGHTIGHALESFAMAKNRPVLHGYAIAWGMVCELYLSAAYYEFPEDLMRTVINFINDRYGKMDFTCDDYDEIYEYIRHDKKNEGDEILFTLLSAKGQVRINRPITKEQIFHALDFYRDGQG